MSNTPETDAAWQADKDTVFRVETSRKLERERDNAREKAERYRREANKFMLQRDESQEALMRIEDLFINCTDIYEDFKNMGMIAKAALEETK